MENERPRRRGDRTNSYIMSFASRSRETIVNKRDGDTVTRCVSRDATSERGFLNAASGRRSVGRTAAKRDNISHRGTNTIREYED